MTNGAVFLFEDFPYNANQDPLEEGVHITWTDIPPSSPLTQDVQRPVGLGSFPEQAAPAVAASSTIAQHSSPLIAEDFDQSDQCLARK